VIALKIFGFVSQAGEQPRRVFHLGLAFAAGVLVFFLALAAIAVGLRSAGHGFFWGMQFSDPRLLIGLISLVVLFAMSMFGTFDITLGGTAENTIGKLASRDGFGGAFVHGLFTTLLGTSCTAPFVGPVLGFAVTQPPAIIFSIFATMAVGMSLPYVLLTWQPAWMRFLPKPGVWMERFKQLMGFVLLAVVVWLLGVVGSTRGASAMTATAWFLTILALAGWIFGAGQRRWWAVILAVMVATAGGKFFLPDAMRKAPLVTKEIKANSVGIVWEPFSEERLAEARKAGPVFIDFTADWCPNCKTNEALVINTKAVADVFKAKKVTTLVADWTDFDPAITAKIKGFQRIGVPVYVYYLPGSPDPIVLPEILTQSILLRPLADIKS
ncbi:MAG: thioredoxin family protein, partial [Chthoniobacteraceae bacterium]